MQRLLKILKWSVPGGGFIALFLAMGLFITILFMSSKADDARDEFQKMMEAQSRTEKEYNQQVLDLSIEFGYDPLIVQVVLQESSRAFRQNRCKCATWRFVNSEKELAYLILSLIQTESHGNPAAYNPGGPAYGLTQMLLTTARQYDHDVTPGELYAIPKSISISVDHFVSLLKKYNGNYTLAVIAWNRGSGGVDRSIALGTSPENGYARKVFEQAILRNAK